jgi:hypothetical protein
MENLRPGSREMGEGGRWEGQNFKQLKKVQRLEEEEELEGEEEKEEEELNDLKRSCAVVNKL